MAARSKRTSKKVIAPIDNLIIPSDVRRGSPNFVGREQNLEGLHKKLQEEGKVSVCAVRGMGGIGKTELAIQYAHKFQQDYVAHYWFSLNQENLANQVLLKATSYLAMPEELRKSGTIEEQVKWCWQNWHPSEGDILVILDDVKTLEDIPLALMPIDSRFKVMVTTRQRNLSPSFRELPLGVLSEKESLELLKKIVDAEGTLRIQQEIETAKQICCYLGYLPLALELAANYLKDDEMLTLEEYLQQLNLQDESLGDEMVRGITAERGVIAAFELSWKRLQGLSSQLAMLLSRFAPAPIPWRDFEESTVNSLEWEKEAVTKARKQLANLSLIEIQNSKNIVIHALLRKYFRYQSEQEDSDFIHKLQQAITISSIAIAKTIPYTPIKEDIERVRLAIPHLELVSQAFLDYIPNPDDDNNLIWAFLGVARFYEGQGQYNSAETYLYNCLETVQSRSDKKHLDVAFIINNLGKLYQLQGKYEEAEPLLLKSLTLRQQFLGDHHPDVATSLDNLASLYFEQGKNEKVEPLYLQSLELRQQILGENHPDVATSLNNLARWYHSEGKYKKAKPLYLQSLALRQQILGENHPDVATSLHNLARWYRSQGRYKKAKHLYLQSLALTKQLLGENHPSVATSLHNLALFYEMQGRYKKAEHLYLQSLALTKQLLGDHHYSVATTLNNLGRLYHSQGRYKKAEPFYLQSLTLRRQLLGNHHYSVAVSLNNLAKLYEYQGRYEEAEPLFLEALQICEQSFGISSPTTIIVRKNYKIYLRRRRWNVNFKTLSSKINLLARSLINFFRKLLSKFF